MAIYPTGIVPTPGDISGGNKVKSSHVLDLYEEVTSLETIIGLDPLDGHANIAERIYDSEQILAGAMLDGSTSAVLDGVNIGSGAPVFIQKGGQVLEFRSIVAGSGVALVYDSGSITISATGVSGGGGSGVASITGIAPIETSGGNISITQSSASMNGYLSSGDWSAFNAKQPAGSYLASGDTTSVVPEGSNLYYTNARADARVGLIGSGLFQPSGNYLVSGTTTSSIPEGSNLYYTTTRVNNHLSGVGSITYNNGAIGTTLTQYTDAMARAVVSGSSPIIVSSGLVSIQQSSASQNGYLSSGDWSTFNSKQVAGSYLVSGTTTSSVPEGSNLYYTNTRVFNAISGSAPISVSSGLVSVQQATSGTNGYLSSSDWAAFNAKQPSGNYMKKDSKVITVGLDGSQDYTSLSGALAYAATLSPSLTNPIAVWVNAGIYTESELVVPSYVSIVGINMETVFIETPAEFSGTLMTLSPDSNLSFVTLLNSDNTAGSKGILINDAGAYIDIHKVYLKYFSKAITIENVTPNSTNYLYLEYISIDSIPGAQADYAISIASNEGGTTFFQLNSTDFQTYSSDFNPIKTVLVSGPDVEAIFVGAVLVGSDSADGCGFCFYNGATLKINAALVSDYGIGLHNENIGSAGTVNTLAFGIKDCAEAVKIEHPTTAGSIFGGFSRQASSSASDNVAMLINDNVNFSTVSVGDFYSGPSLTEQTEIAELWREGATMGLYAPDPVLHGSYASGLTITVDASDGYLQDSSQILKKYTWTQQSIAVPAISVSYIYINENGTLTYAGSRPSLEQSIYLGRVVTGPSGVYAVQQTRLNSHHIGNHFSEYLRDVFGAIFEDGCVVTNPSGAYLNVGQGEYYYGENKFLVSGVNNFYWDEWYHNLLSIWVNSGVLTNQVNVTQYDPSGSGIALIPSGQYVKHSVYLNADDLNGDSYYLVLGQQADASQSVIENAATNSAPAFFSDSVVHLADIVVKQGSGIIEIIDQRPTPSFAAGGVLQGNLLHANLQGLGADDHTQYLLVDGTRAMTSNLDLGTNNITNVGTVDGIDISSHASRHLPNGADPLAGGLPSNIAVGAAATGIANAFARSDHEHGYSYPTAANVGALPTGTTTTSIGEGSNLYYTDARARAVMSGTSPVSVANGLVSISQASASGNGYLSSGDWSTFNSKQAAGNYVVTDSSATLASLSTSSFISGATLYDSGNRVITSVNGKSGPTATLTTADINENTNLYYTDARARAVVSGTAPITVSNGLVSMSQSSASTNGYLSSGDWSTFNSKESVLTFNGPLSRNANTVSGYYASTSSSGFLSSTDWNTFNNKQGALATGNITSSVTNVLSISGGTGAVIGGGATLSMNAAGASSSGYLTKEDWSTFNGKESALTFNGPLSRNANTVSGFYASTSSSGFLSSTDWNTFNNKQPAGTYNTTIASSGNGISLVSVGGPAVTQYLNSISGVGTVTITGPTNGVLFISGSAAGGGITSINSQSGPSISITGVGTVTVTEAGNVITVSGASASWAGGQVTSDIYPNSYGTLNVGVLSTPFSGAYIQNMWNTPVLVMTYNETPGGTINSSNKVFSLLNAPARNSLQLFYNGAYQKPNTDYTLSGSTITYINAPATGGDHVCNYGYQPY